MSLFNKSIFSFDPKVFGIDLSDLSIKALQLEKSGEREGVRSYSCVDIPPGIIEDGKIIYKEKVIELLKEAVRIAAPNKITSRKVVCSLPESKAFIRIITIPKMKKEEAEEAVKWEMEATIPLPIDQVYFDWQFLGESSTNKQSVLTVAVSKDIVDDCTEVLLKAGLEVYGLEVESLASARSLVKEKKEDNSSWLIVDLGARRTSFIMVVKGAVYFTSSIPFSCENLNDVIAKSMGMDLKEAENIKIQHGLGSMKDDPSLFNIMKPLLENLINEIQKTLDFYKDISRENSQINGIILCGGGANLKGLVPYLTRRLEKETVIGNPWVNMRLGDRVPIIAKEYSVQYSTAIGLALRGLYYEDYT